MSHAALAVLARSRVRQQLRKQGYSLIESIQLAALVDDSMMDAALSATPEARQRLGAIGDGTLIQALIDFLNSELGQSLIQLLIQLILGGL